MSVKIGSKRLHEMLQVVDDAKALGETTLSVSTEEFEYLLLIAITQYGAVTEMLKKEAANVG